MAHMGLYMDGSERSFQKKRKENMCMNNERQRNFRLNDVSINPCRTYIPFTYLFCILSSTYFPPTSRLPTYSPMYSPMALTQGIAQGGKLLSFYYICITCLNKHTYERSIKIQSLHCIPTKIQSSHHDTLHPTEMRSLHCIKPK